MTQAPDPQAFQRWLDIDTVTEILVNRPGEVWIEGGALTAYKSGERKHPTMRAIAGSLNDQDMADLAAYYSTQSPTSPRNPLK